MSKEISDFELMEVAADPEQARRLHKALRTLAGNPNVTGPLKDMAREVLNGRLGMNEALDSAAWRGAVGDRMAELHRIDQQMTPEDRAAARERAERWFEQQEQQEQQERDQQDRQPDDQKDQNGRPGQDGSEARPADPRDIPPAYRPPTRRD
ncbi:hypothetical protein ACFWVC_33820 [Streptomyces sp. NPDC058691]|uniref:hypothetical protein n=1 Tax=Streptomyces sp. NPDC058691 TaxID=3346601 RepID=UPI003648BF1C